MSRLLEPALLGDIIKARGRKVRLLLGIGRLVILWETDRDGTETAVAPALTFDEDAHT